MKITDIQGTGVTQVQNEKVNAVEPRGEHKTEAAQNPDTDNIHLSEKARLMQKASRVIAETPDVREEKIRALQEAVDQGAYGVDPQKVANSIIANLIMER